MLPHDLSPARLRLPPGERGPAVYLSGNRPRHLRLGYLLQAHFPGLVADWWMFMPGLPGQPGTRAREQPARSPALARAMTLFRRGQLRELAGRARRKLHIHELRRMSRKVRAYLAPDELDRVEQALIGSQVAELKSGARVHPLPVGTAVSPARLADLSALKPYFLIVYGAPALHDAVLATVRGLALCQHDGRLSARTGNAVEDALYHRRLDQIGSAVFTVAPDGSMGQVLRRSACALHPDDTWHHCVMAAAALGNKLVVDVIHDACMSEELVGFVPPHGASGSPGTRLGPGHAGHGHGQGQGRSDREADLLRRDVVRRDLARGWLADALDATTDF